ncbi:MAG TPA: ATPase [Treponema sp.]|nr:ATPase [Treponema sp.]
MSDIKKNPLFLEVKDILDNAKKEMAKRIVGQEEVVEGVLTALVAGGHVLLEGVPGLAKTLIIKSFSDISGLDFKRIQFTPDLLPADLVGTLMYDQQNGQFYPRKGPVFTNLLLADEINRAPAKVQSALLEAMAEGQVTIGDTTHILSEPFFVMATQNPIEQEGTYNLPEAELDRFLLKILVNYPSAEEEMKIVKNGKDPLKIPVNIVFTSENLEKCKAALSKVHCDDKIIEYIVSLVAVTRPETEKKSAPLRVSSATASIKKGDDILRYISFGASPRASIALCLCAKVQALFESRDFVLPEDVKKAALHVLRHRLVLSYEAAADGISADALVSKILTYMPTP